MRTIADLPRHGVSVKLELRTRRFRCQNSLCAQRIFCERLPRVVAHYARKTVRLNDEQRSLLEKLCQFFPQIERAKELAQAFTRTGRERSPTEFNEWLRSAMRSILKEFVSFAGGLSQDYEAVINALRYEWSNGQLEGQVNRLKLVKRLMYGRAKFDLLKARVLHST